MHTDDRGWLCSFLQDKFNAIVEYRYFLSAKIVCFVS